MFEIQMPYKDGVVVSIKLSSGEEMIATLVQENTTEVVVSRPRMLAAGDKGMILAPYMFTVNPDAKYALRLNSVICICKTEAATAKSYSTQTSGIAII